MVKLCSLHLSNLQISLYRDQPWLTRQFSNVVYTMRTHVKFNYPNVSMSILTSPRYEIIAPTFWSSLTIRISVNWYSCYSCRVDVCLHGSGNTVKPILCGHCWRTPAVCGQFKKIGPSILCLHVDKPDFVVNAQL